MVKLKFIKTLRGTNETYEKDKVYEFTNNVAFGFLEMGYAKVYKDDWKEVKGFEEPPKDKMISKKRGRRKLRTK